MERKRFAVSILISAVSVAVGIWGLDGAMIALSLMAVIFSVASFFYCSGGVFKYSMIASATVLVCTIIMVTVASFESLVNGGVMSEYSWTFVSAIIRGIAAMPLIIAFFFATAAVFKASYNWVVVPGLGWLVGMGMQVPQLVMLFIVQVPGFLMLFFAGQPATEEQEIIANATIVMGMLVNLVMFAVFSIVLRSVFKKNRYLINANGLEVRK